MYFVIHNADHFFRSVLAVYRGGETYTRGAQPIVENGCDVKTRKVNHQSIVIFCKVNCFVWRYVVVYTRNDTEQVILDFNQSENKQKDNMKTGFPFQVTRIQTTDKGASLRDLYPGAAYHIQVWQQHWPHLRQWTTTLTTSSTHFWMIPTAHIHYFAGVCCEPRSSIGTPPKFPSRDSEPSAQPHHRSGPGGHH